MALEDTFKLADEVRAENRGETWDAATQTAVPAPTEVPPEQSPEEKVDTEEVENQ